MSGKRARSERRSVSNEDPGTRHARAALASAEQILALDLTSVPCARLTQVIVGWMRAAFEQSRVIANHALAGLSHAAAPNRRAFIEITTRIQWLHSIPADERARVVETLIEEDRVQTRKAARHLSDMGYDSPVDLSDMESMILDAHTNGPHHQQAQQFLAAVRALQGQAAGLYYAWREDTQYTHATSVVAVAHAPEREGLLATARPRVPDPDLETHRLATALIVTLVARMLMDVGVDPDRATVVMNAFFVSA